MICAIPLLIDSFVLELESVDAGVEDFVDDTFVTFVTVAAAAPSPDALNVAPLTQEDGDTDVHGQQHSAMTRHTCRAHTEGDKGGGGAKFDAPAAASWDCVFNTSNG